MEIKIVATTGRARGQGFDLKAAKTFIGAHENCQIRPDITGLGGIHALIEQREGRIYLRDFGDAGGTGLNDRVLLARETEIFDGDLIQVGPMVLTLTLVARGDTSIASHSHVPVGWPFVGDIQAEEPARVEKRPAMVPQPAFAAEKAPLPGRPLVMGQPYEPARNLPPPTPRIVPEERPLPRAQPTLVADSGSRSTAALLLKPVARRALNCDLIDGVLVVTILPVNLDEEASVSPVRYELRSLLEDEAPGRMIINLGQTRYLSSRAVGVILAHYQAMDRLGGTLRVCGVSREIKPVLDQMRLSMLIDVYPTVDEAVSDSWD